MKHNNSAKRQRSEGIYLMHDGNFSYTSEREVRGFYFLQLEDNSLSPGSCRSFEPELITALDIANWCQVFRKKNLTVSITHS